MVKQKEYKGSKIFVCESCGFAYSKKEIAQKCEEHCTTKRSCSIEIIKQAIKTK